MKAKAPSRYPCDPDLDLVWLSKHSFHSSSDEHILTQTRVCPTTASSLEELTKKEVSETWAHYSVNGHEGTIYFKLPPYVIQDFVLSAMGMNTRMFAEAKNDLRRFTIEVYQDRNAEVLYSIWCLNSWLYFDLVLIRSKRNSILANLLSKRSTRLSQSKMNHPQTCAVSLTFQAYMLCSMTVAYSRCK